MAKAKKVEQYKNHRAGSRKGSVHKCFDSHGWNKAMSYGKMRGLKESTLTQWFRTWKRDEEGPSSDQQTLDHELPASDEGQSEEAKPEDQGDDASAAIADGWV